ncbi:MAG: hypothetical protein JXQ73_01980 [Phycisphaerae bacterium]|nr:hypothetical protein [Phycisphaerae bacterium]
MKSPIPYHQGITSILACATLYSSATGAQKPDRQAVFEYCAKSGHGAWRDAQEPAGNLSSRTLFRYALALCETNTHMDRLPRLFELAAKMQDRDPSGSTYGNFRWYWREDRIRDRNAVDFCMKGASLIWIRHRDRLPEATRKILRELCEYGIEGCLRHRVPSSYTNISLMNALDLILLGEALDRPDVADEGYARLDRFCIYTWRCGIHEYCSPTYYGVDVECLLLLEAFCKRPRGQEQATALLELIWTDVALNWYPGSDRLGGACSRDYDYLAGSGHLDSVMWLAGWLPGQQRGGGYSVFAALGRWQPPQRLRDLNRTRLPRLVQQRWGPEPSQSRTCLMCNDVVLSTAGANYGPMDLPLTVDLPGGRDKPRCYFIPDGRGDPYGKKKIEQGAHSKALHLRPFWAATQRAADAIGLVVYRRGDVLPDMRTLETHFVMRRDVQGFWIGDRPVDLRGKQPKSFDVPDGQAVVLREGTAAVGIRVPWSRNVDGKPARRQLVYDGNAFGVVRLTVTHHGTSGESLRKEVGQGPEPGAALWVRVGSGLKSDQDFQAWRRAFADASVQVKADASDVRVEAAASEGPIVLAASTPYRLIREWVPKPERFLLALDGKDLGREIIERIEPVASFRKTWTNLPMVALSPGGSVELEAEAGALMPTMRIGQDPAASGGKYVWLPGEPGKKGGGSGSGSVTWRLRIERPGSHYLYGRVLTPTPDDDSFFVRVATESTEIIGMAAWHTGTHEKWTWTPLRLDNSRKRTGILLPAGVVYVELHAREDGAKIDKLFVTDNPDASPKD